MGKEWGGRLGMKMFSGGSKKAINWFPGHMAVATRAILKRLKIADLVIEVRDARIPLSSVNVDLQQVISHKKRVIALNKKDLANPRSLQKWIKYFKSCDQECIPVNAHDRSSVSKLLALVEIKLKELMCKEPTFLVMMVGVPNVGKSSLINSIHQIASMRFPEQYRKKRATVGPLPGVTQDIAGFKIAHRPSIYVLDTPGVLVPNIVDVETGLKLALTGAVKDSVVGEERLAEYLLAFLDLRLLPLQWKYLDILQVKGNESGPGSAIGDRSKLSSTKERASDLVIQVQRTIYGAFSQYESKLDVEDEVESLIEEQLNSLRKAMRIPHRSDDEARTMVSKKLLSLFRLGKLGQFTLDAVPDEN